jgi:hypothetical protein
LSRTEGVVVLSRTEGVVVLKLHLVVVVIVGVDGLIVSADVLLAVLCFLRFTGCFGFLLLLLFLLVVLFSFLISAVLFRFIAFFPFILFLLHFVPFFVYMLLFLSTSPHTATGRHGQGRREGGMSNSEGWRARDGQVMDEMTHSADRRVRAEDVAGVDK